MTVFHAIYHALIIYHHMPHNSCSLLLTATWVVYMPFFEVFLSTICYSSTACYTVCYLLPCAVQFVVCCCYTPYSLLLVAACHTVCYLLPHAVQLLFVAACHTVAICCHMLYSWLSVATCRTVAICCRTPYSCYLLLHAVQFATCCHMPYS